MCVVVRRWAKQSGIADASKGTFNSYTLNLVILHFLLYDVDTPVFRGFHNLSGHEHQLDTLAFVRDYQPQLMKGTLTNDTTVTRLLKGFFNYYANFDFTTHAVSLATRDPYR
ncbi:PAP/25A associated domain containing protein [Aphelenchoides avenae]|nr:PAP/25A associated domain containing protein [Aphelenchus avenae]